ncbi:hypothetical protein Ahy_A07g031734 isoform L [Arachis hypogaea]|uniref:Uncharacterized protein n=1 Tax=Arachis hypogaea TaxID=3818 RepID=A0A445C4V5_ARAHY|nr:hypothetical protein Ahy_A07g031734 isoform L [Arachis hypogaea]
MNPFLSPPPSATEPFQSFTQRRRTFRPSTSSQTAPANTIVAEPAPPASPPTASFLASRRQHHPATHSIVSGLAETRIAAAIESSQIRSLQFRVQHSSSQSPTTPLTPTSSSVITELGSHVFYFNSLASAFNPRSSSSINHATMATNDSNRVGLVISTTESIRVFLSGASQDPNLSHHLRHTSADLLSQSELSYEPLRSVWMASDPSTRPELTQLFSGTRFVFSSPKPRQKSEELKSRLKKLQDLAERKAYQELVKDIAPKKEVEEPFSSYKDQLGFGLHVVVTMFTGYLVGYAAFRALFNHSPAMVPSKICFSLLSSISLVLVVSQVESPLDYPFSFFLSYLWYRMLLEEFLGWWWPCLLRLSFSLLEVLIWMPVKQGPVKHRNQPFPHPVSRKTSSFDQLRKLRQCANTAIGF